MKTIIIISATALTTWVFLYEYLYSPKARIRRLWNEIFVISHETGKHSSEDSVADSLIKESFEKAIQKKEKMINSLLDYYFDPEEDRGYIEENKPQNR